MSSSPNTYDAPTQKSTTIWFEDGNIVLEVESTLFRVHKSMLCIHSAILRDMFSVSQPEVEKDRIIDGCPVVAIPDRAADWENLLKVFYFGVSVWNASELPPSAMIAAMLRLGHKYDIVGCRDEAVARLQSYFPKTLQAFQHRSTNIFRPPGSSSRDDRFFVELFHLVLELRLQTMYPTLFLITITLPKFPDILYSGLKEKGATILNLPTHVHRSLVVGRDNLVATMKERVFHFLFTPMNQYATDFTDECRSEDECVDAQRDLIESTFAPPNVNLAFSRPTIPSGRNFTAGMCAQCSSRALRSLPADQKSLWDELPSLFLLPAWDELKNFNFD